MRTLKRYSIVLIVVAFVGCDNEDAFDCIKTVGDINHHELDLEGFNKIELIGDIQLYIENSETQSVLLATGDNLFPKIDLEVVDGQLTISDNNKCTWARDYGNTVVTVKSNGISLIKNSGSRDVVSIGTYNIDKELYLISQNASGDYYLDVSGNYLNISSNKVSNFEITGSLEKLYVGFYSGHGRFEGQNLTANTVSIFHRGANDILVKPTLLLDGSIESFGDIVVYGQPEVVDIEYNGKSVV